MTVTEKVMAVGRWELKLRDSCPMGVRSALDYFGHVAITDSRLPQVPASDTFLSAATYMGVLRDKKDRNSIGGCNLLMWLGDEDKKGPVIEGIYPGGTLWTFNTAVLNVTGGANPTGFESPNRRWVATKLVDNASTELQADYLGGYITKREWLDYFCQFFGTEYRVTPDGWLLAGSTTDRYPYVMRADAMTSGNYWRLNETTGTTAFDTSLNPSPKNGTYNGTTARGVATQIVGGGGVYFYNGSYITLPALSVFAAGSGGIEGWVRVDTPSTNGCFMHIGSNANGIGVGVGQGDMDHPGNNLIVNLPGGSGAIDTGVAIGTGWHFVAVDCGSGPLMKVQLDRDDVYTNTSYTLIAPTTGGSIGSQNGSRPFTGAMTEWMALSGSRAFSQRNYHWLLGRGLFVERPRVLISPHGTGFTAALRTVEAPVDLQRDVEQFCTRVIVVAKGSGSAVVLGAANIASNPYKDLWGNPVPIVRMVDAPQTPTSGDANYLAGSVLSRSNAPRRQMTLNLNTPGMRRYLAAGDAVWVYDPTVGLYDPANEVRANGETTWPVNLRVFSMTWPVEPGMGVYYRDKNGVYTDLSDYVEFEAGPTQVEVGAPALPPYTGPLTDQAAITERTAR